MKKNRVLSVLLILVLGFAVTACGGQGNTIANEKAEEIKQGIRDMENDLQFDVSATEDIVEYMGRSVDNVERGSGDLRRLIYEMEDGSELVFVMKPATIGDGLKLKEIRSK